MVIKKSKIDRCPNVDDLSAFMNGRVVDSIENRRISDHLEMCDTCIAILTSLQSQDEFVDSLKRAVSNNSIDESVAISEIGYQDALARVLDIANEYDPEAHRSTNNIARPTTPDSSRVIVDEPRKYPATFGPYQLIEKIGEGGMGLVYRAVHTPMDRPVAIKLLPKNRLTEPKARKRFFREMQTIGKLNHRNIVIGHDAGEIDEQHYLAMELLDGYDLATLTTIHGQPLSYPDACELARATAIALKYAHKNAIVHRDVKPSNIMLCVDRIDDTSDYDERTAGTVVKLLDLGLARIELPDTTELSMTGHDQIMGTIDYMSPEQCIDSSDVDARSDIYSLGATLFFLLVGKPPLKAIGCASQGQKLQYLVSSELPSLRKFRSDLPDELIEIVDRALKHDPFDRYQDIREMIGALEPLCHANDLANLFKNIRENDQKEQDSKDFSVGQPLSPNRPRRPAPPREKRTETEQQILDQLFAQPSGQSSSRVLKWTLIGFVLVAIAAIAFSIYWLKTDGGYVRIETEPGVEVTIEVLKDGKKIDHVSVGKNDKHHWYYSGEYKIQIPAQQKDQLTIESDQFTLSRGGNVVVKINKVADKPQADATSDAGDDSPANVEPIHPREVIEWVTNNGGSVHIQRGEIEKPSEIPDGEIEISTIGLRHANNAKVHTLVEMVTRLDKCEFIYLNGGPNQMVTDECMTDIKRLKNIKRLTFESAKITDKGVQKLDRMPKLTSLGLLNLMVTEKCLASVSVKFPNLYRLELNSDSIAGSDLLPLTTMKQLRNFDLITPKISKELVRPLVSTEIEQLIIRGARTYEPGVAETIAQMPKLKFFEIQNTRFGDEDLRKLVLCKTLGFIRISVTSITVDGLREFIDKRPEITIYIDYSESPLLELKNLPQVKDVSIPNTGPINRKPPAKSK